MKIVAENLNEFLNELSNRPDNLFTRNDIIEIMYRNQFPLDAIKNLQKKVATWSEDKFLDYVEKKDKFKLERFRKNLYQIK